MSDQLEQAALAFQQDMGGSSAPSRQSEEGGAPEPLFGNLGDFADNSEDNAGGDEAPAPAPKPKKAERNEEAIDDEGNYINDDAEGADESDTEGKDGDEEGGDDEAGDAGAEEEGKFEVVVDGEPVEVTMREALDGYVRTETFHRRLNELSEFKKVLTAEAANINTRRTQYIEKLTEAEELVKGIIPNAPDWDKLYAQNPVEARKLQKEYELLEAKVKEIRTNREAAQQEATTEEAKETAAYIQAEFETFISHNPRIRKEADLAKELNSMKRTALSVGFSEQEVNVVYDSRMLRILQKASKYDRMMAAKPKPVQQGKRVNTSSAVVNKAAHRDVNKAQTKLQRTGSIEDAAAVFKNLIK